MTDKLSKTKQLDEKGLQTLLALLQTKTHTAAAKHLSLNRNTLYARIKKYGLDKIIAQIPKEALIRLQLGSVKAADTLVGALDERPNKMEAAKEILDRVGITSKQPTFAQQIKVGSSDEMKIEFIHHDED